MQGVLQTFDTQTLLDGGLFTQTGGVKTLVIPSNYLKEVVQGW